MSKSIENSFAFIDAAILVAKKEKIPDEDGTS